MSNASEAYAADRAEAEALVFKHGGIDMCCTVCGDWCVRPTWDAGKQHGPCVVWTDGNPSFPPQPGVWKPLYRKCWFYDSKYERVNDEWVDYIAEYRVTTREPPGDYRGHCFWRSDRRLSDEEITDWFGFVRLSNDEVACRRDGEPYRRPLAKIARSANRTLRGVRDQGLQ